MVSLSVRAGRAVGLIAINCATGGAAFVGKSRLRSTVELGLGGGVGVREAVPVGRICSGVNVSVPYDNMDGCVGVYRDG